MRFKITGLCLALSVLAACSSSSVDQSAATGAGATMNAAVPGSAEDFVQNVGDRVFFAFDRYDVAAEGQAVLHRQAEWLKKYPSTLVVVEGHCDERGTREYNLALGERRAHSVKNYLISLGVDANRVEVISYGKERPFVVGSNEETWAQNRVGRTVIK
ncbi:MAG: peptidoglycan-associated lipoprotein Pal [Alphaproteobacteria bacterium]|nr:peptidoglycan-associated lipoprotein Pal [Alphaproteobacteria bacterium]OJV45333.1 MAG: peptidoglycan-associated lipoprotein [Alphaproteobacteria bacterium 43-37]